MWLLLKQLEIQLKFRGFGQEDEIEKGEMNFNVLILGEGDRSRK